MTRHVNAVDWSRTLAYAATPSSQGIHIVEHVPGTDAPMPEDVRAKLSVELAAELLELRRPWDGRPAIDEVWTREQSFAGPFELLGPDISMILADAGTMSILPSQEILARRDPARGHHRWEGTFVAAGPGIRSGHHGRRAVARRRRAAAAAPARPAGARRRRRAGCRTAIFEDGELERRPPRMVPAAAAPADLAASAADLALDPAEQAALMDRLQALGYVE